MSSADANTGPQTGRTAESPLQIPARGWKEVAVRTWKQASEDNIGLVAAGVAFYGSAPNVEDVPKIRAPLMIQSAEKDDRINASWPAYEEALKAANVRYQRFLYPGTQHGFHNDTTPRYDKDAATLAWDRTIEFFKKNLKG